eukprot:3404509-Rhodomonas_salina.2
MVVSPYAPDTGRAVLTTRVVLRPAPIFLCACYAMSGAGYWPLLSVSQRCCLACCVVFTLSSSLDCFACSLALTEPHGCLSPGETAHACSRRLTLPPLLILILLILLRNLLRFYYNCSILSAGKTTHPHSGYCNGAFNPASGSEIAYGGNVGTNQSAGVKADAISRRDAAVVAVRFPPLSPLAFSRRVS